MEHATALVVDDATAHCRFAARQPWHVCIRRDGAPLPAGETCWYEAHAQAASDPQNCAHCGGQDPDYTDGAGVQWHDGCAAEAALGDPDAYDDELVA